MEIKAKSNSLPAAVETGELEIVVLALDASVETVASIPMRPGGCDELCPVKLTEAALAPLIVTDWLVGVKV